MNLYKSCGERKVWRKKRNWHDPLHPLIKHKGTLMAEAIGADLLVFIDNVGAIYLFG